MQSLMGGLANHGRHPCQSQAATQGMCHFATPAASAVSSSPQRHQDTRKSFSLRGPTRGGCRSSVVAGQTRNPDHACISLAEPCALCGKLRLRTEGRAEIENHATTKTQRKMRAMPQKGKAQGPLPAMCGCPRGPMALRGQLLDRVESSPVF